MTGCVSLLGCLGPDSISVGGSTKLNLVLTRSSFPVLSVLMVTSSSSSPISSMSSARSPELQYMSSNCYTVKPLPCVHVGTFLRCMDMTRLWLRVIGVTRVIWWERFLICVGVCGADDLSPIFFLYLLTM